MSKPAVAAQQLLEELCRSAGLQAHMTGARICPSFSALHLAACHCDRLEHTLWGAAEGSILKADDECLIMTAFTALI